MTLKWYEKHFKIGEKKEFTNSLSCIELNVTLVPEITEKRK